MRWVKALFVHLLVLGALVLGSTSAAGAQESDPTRVQRFIMRVHGDFLVRQPSAAELVWWEAYLTGNTRGAFLNQILTSSEFDTLYVAHTYQEYLDRLPTSGEASAALSALTSSNNYLATEVTVLGSADYYSAAGGTNTAFLQALYPDLMGRAPDSGGLTYWLNRLATGTTRNQVVVNFARSSEGTGYRVAGRNNLTECEATSLADIDARQSGSYCLVLDRMADSGGKAYWMTQMQGTGQMPTLWANLAASAEYWNWS